MRSTQTDKDIFKIITSFIFFTAFLFACQSLYAQVSENTPLYQCWKLETKPSSDIASDNASKIYYYTENGLLEAIDIKDGKIIWKTELGGEIISKLLFAEDKLYLVTTKTSPDTAAIAMTNAVKPAENTNNANNREKSIGITIRIQAVSAQTGLPLQQKTFEVRGNQTALTRINLFDIDNKLYLISDYGELLILDKLLGNIEKRINLEINLSGSPILSNRDIYLGTLEKVFDSFSVKTNELTRQFDLKESASTIVFGNNGNVYIGDNLGTVYAYSLNSKKILWKVRTGAKITDIKVNDKMIFISSNDNFIYSVAASSGNTVWKKKFAGRNETALSAEKDLLFTATINTDIFTVTSAKKGKTVNQLYLPTDDFFIGSPFLLGNYVVLPTNSGFSVYSLNKCQTDGAASQFPKKNGDLNLSVSY